MGRHAKFGFAYLPRRLMKLLNIKLRPLLIRMRPMDNVRQIFRRLFRLVSQTGPILRTFKNGNFHPTSGIYSRVFSPSFHATFMTCNVIKGGLRRTFKRGIICRIISVRLTFLVIGLHAVIRRAVITLHRNILIRMIILTRPYFNGLGGLTIRGFGFLVY